MNKKCKINYLNNNNIRIKNIIIILIPAYI